MPVGPVKPPVGTPEITSLHLRMKPCESPALEQGTASELMPALAPAPPTSARAGREGDAAIVESAAPASAIAIRVPRLCVPDPMNPPADRAFRDPHPFL